MIRNILAFVFVFSFAVSANAEDVKMNGAELRAVDKITGRKITFSVPVGDTYHYESLSILLHTCLAHPPEETPENKAFLDISESKFGAPSENVFRGWMFSSSPALSAMEHPVYDIWVLKCKNIENARVPEELPKVKIYNEEEQQEDKNTKTDIQEKETTEPFEF